MITHHKVLIASIAVVASVGLGAIVGSMEGHGGIMAQPTTQRTTQGRTTRHTTNETMTEINLTSPFISEDRYVDGAWVGHPTPSGLPHASGQCDPCN